MTDPADRPAPDEPDRPDPLARDRDDPGRPDPLARDLDEVERPKPERAFNVGATLGVVLTVAAAIFVIQNAGTTAFEWLWFDFDLPLWIVLLASFAVGALLVLVALGVHRRRSKRIGRRREAAGRLRRALGGSHPQAGTA